MPRRTQRIDSALPSKNPGIWIVTILILVAGAVLLLTATGRSARERSAVMQRVQIGDSVQRVTEVLAMDAERCPGSELDHLRESFPEGWPAASIDVATETLTQLTQERLVYPLVEGREVLCSGSEQRTEIGIAEDGTVLWSVAVLGRTTLQLPGWVTPAGAEEVVEDST
ncbi:MAG: hypothetical protein WD766_14985 [Gemmatimonadota bacterium]